MAQLLGIAQGESWDCFKLKYLDVILSIYEVTSRRRKRGARFLNDQLQKWKQRHRPVRHDSLIPSIYVVCCYITMAMTVNDGTVMTVNSSGTVGFSHLGRILCLSLSGTNGPFFDFLKTLFLRAMVISR